MICQKVLNNRVVTLLFLLLAALYICRSAFGCHSQLWLDATKAAPVLFLGIATWLAGGKKLLPAAMILSAAGDIAGEHSALLWQIGFFAAAHIAFILHFLQYAKIDKNRVKLLILWGVAMALWGIFIVSHIEDITIHIACSIYILIIGTMTASTLLIESRYRWWYVVAALVFVISDSCIAWNRFIAHFNHAGLTIMTTYFTAQLIFANLYLKER